MFKTTRGLVLREVRYKEADRILTVLTEDMGKMTVKARGALRKGSKIAAATQFLVFSELTMLERATASGQSAKALRSKSSRDCAVI